MSKYESSLHIDNPNFSYELEISAAGSLRAVGIANKITGEHFQLGRRD